MPIRTRMLMVLAVVMGLGLGADWAIYRKVIVPSYATLERDEVQADLEECLTDLRRDIQLLARQAGDWGAWDDSCAFVKNRNPQFVEANLGTVTFEKNGLNVLCVLDRTGAVVWAEARDLDRVRRIELPEFAGPAWPADHPLLARGAAGGPVAGILPTGRGPMLVAAVPVLTSTHEGPPQGTLVMGRFLDRTCEKRLCGRVFANLAFRPWPDEAAPGGDAAARRALASDPAGFFFDDGDRELLRTYTTFPGVNGRPALLVRADRERRILRKGRSAAQLATGSVALAGLAFLGVLMALLGRLVIRPLDGLKNRAIAIRESGNFSQRLGSPRGDEIGQLSREFDHLLDRIEGVTRGLEAQVAGRTAELRHVNAQLERRVAERTARVRQTERRMRHLVANSPAVIYSIRASGNHAATFITENVRELLGFEAHEFLDDPEFWGRHVHPDDLPRVTAAAPGLQDAGALRTEYRFQHKDGSWRRVREDMRLVRDADGRPQEVVGSWLDVTESKEAEDRAQIYHQALEATLDTVTITDMQGNLVYVNAAGCALYGGPVADVLGQPVSNFHADAANFANVIVPAMQTRGCWAGEVGMRRKDGSVVPGLASLTLIRPAGGAPLGVVGIFRSIPPVGPTGA